MADLILKENIEVETNHGHCEIHLNFGSITKLKREDAVDVLVISAFPGDYSPTPTSVVGALKRDLNISVRDLSKDKEEDHRRLFSCWWSKPLDGKYSFKRILCFEGSFKIGSRPPMVVGEVFRSLVSMCKEKDIKVIMPLLAAGDQGYSQKMMLRLIVETAIHWMQIGLPLKILKIVVFSRDNKELDKNPLLAYYKELKQKWAGILKNENDQPQDQPIHYDVYLSFNVHDEPLANVVVEKLKEKHSEIKIYSKHQELNNEESWQEEIYKVMVTCARVITILTPRFLGDEACLEQYNIALCCSRNMKRDYLAPFYVDSIDGMPTYMCLIQYVDCRPADEAKVSQACAVVVDWLKTHLAELQKLEYTRKIAVAKLSVQHYDVFISYSHQNANAAHELKCFISLFHPHWNIFIDIAELQTGVAWQLKLFHSIEASRYVITLLSPAYLKSKVCQEEYNLASAMHADASYQTKLISILVEEIPELPAWCRDHTPINCKNMSEGAKMEMIQTIDNFEKFNHLQVKDVLSAQDATSSWRTEHIKSGMAFLPSLKIENIMDLTANGTWSSEGNSNETDIMLCFHENDKAMAKFLVDRLHYFLPKARISMPEESKVRHSLLDGAALIVPLLSCSFTASAELTEELNTALCRQRFGNQLVLFPILLEPLPVSPSYFHLIWSLISCEDKVWVSYHTALKYSDETLILTTKKCLDFAARIISLILLNPDHFQGSFKTLLSTNELRDTTLRLRAKMPIDAIGYNPLYFEESKAGHSPSEASTTVNKNSCHSTTGSHVITQPVGSDDELSKKMKNAVGDEGAISKASVQETHDSVGPRVQVDTPAAKSLVYSSPIEESSKDTSKASENAEEHHQGSADEHSFTGSLDRMALKESKTLVVQPTEEDLQSPVDKDSSTGSLDRMAVKESKTLTIQPTDDTAEVNGEKSSIHRTAGKDQRGLVKHSNHRPMLSRTCCIQ